MNNDLAIEIRLSKAKMLQLLLGSVFFIACGIWFLIHPPAIDNPVMGNPWVIKVVSIAAIVFFGVCFFMMVKKLGDTRPGLIINGEGITDQSSGIGAGFIPWSDVQSIQQLNIVSQKLLLLKVNNPAAYINRQTSVMKRKGMEMNYKNYGSPICISTNNLQCDVKELKTMLENKLTIHLENTIQ